LKSSLNITRLFRVFVLSLMIFQVYATVSHASLTTNLVDTPVPACPDFSNTTTKHPATELFVYKSNTAIKITHIMTTIAELPSPPTARIVTPADSAVFPCPMMYPGW
jgi:hypothetical protein